MLFQDAIKSILRNNDTDEAAATVVQMLDADKDGFITKEEIVKFAEALEDVEAETRLRDKEDDVGASTRSTKSLESESDSELSDSENSEKLKPPASSS